MGKSYRQPDDGHVVPFVDLRAQYLAIKAEIDEAVLGVLDSTQFVLGDEVRAFEALFAPYCSVSHAVGVSSGTSALHLALLAVGVGPGDEVITTPHTFIATASAIDYCGARPVFVDIDPLTFNIDPAGIEAMISPRTKAILPVHLYGQSANMDQIVDIAQRYGLAVVEDAAQAHGARYRDRAVGSIGDVGCFSFYPGKNLGAYGEGGAVTTNRQDLAHRVAVLRDWGAEQKYHHELKGYNYRLEGIQGAVLRVKMGHIVEWTYARRAVAARYDKELGPLGVRLPQQSPDCHHVYHVYAIRSRHRDQLQRFLADRGVATGIHYPIPVHLQGAFSELGYQRGTFPEAELAASEVLSLPMFPELGMAQQDQVIAAMAAWMETGLEHEGKVA